MDDEKAVMEDEVLLPEVPVRGCGCDGEGCGAGVRCDEGGPPSIEDYGTVELQDEISFLEYGKSIIKEPASIENLIAREWAESMERNLVLGKMFDTFMTQRKPLRWHQRLRWWWYRVRPRVHWGPCEEW